MAAAGGSLPAGLAAASQEPAVPVRGLRDCALLAPIAQPALICLGQGAGSGGAGVPGSLPGRPQRPVPRMPPAALDAADLPVSVTRSAAWENSMGPPAGGAPTPSRPTLPPPSWQGDWEKAASSKSTQRLWSCPELPAINPGASDFCFASEGVWGRLEVSVYSILRGCC